MKLAFLFLFSCALACAQFGACSMDCDGGCRQCHYEAGVTCYFMNQWGIGAYCNEGVCTGCNIIMDGKKINPTVRNEVLNAKAARAKTGLTIIGEIIAMVDKMRNPTASALDGVTLPPGHPKVTTKALERVVTTMAAFRPQQTAAGCPVVKFGLQPKR